MMNKDWVRWPRGSCAYQDAAQKFVDMASENLGNPPKFSCPCVDCKNLAEPLPPGIIHLHLLKRGMDPTYTEWVLHGEKDISSNDVPAREATRTFYHLWTEANVEGYSPIDPGHETRQDEEDLGEQIAEADYPLYPGCTTHTKLSITIELYRHKTVNGVSRQAFDDLLKTTGSILPPGHCLPKSTYEVKKLLKAFRLTYEKIHACELDCCLFRKELKDANECPICHRSRWKEDTSNMDDADMIDKPRKKIPVKVLRYFPIVPRLERMYKSAELAQQLIWHATNKSKDGKMRHPTDSLAWNHIDTKYPEFASESRNLRFGLSADGFNPFGDLTPAHSCWPVLIVVYNLPPQQCMQSENIMLSMLIPGKKQPGRDIDVYLQPLIDELIELWENGVEVYDAFTKTMFNLKALLMWTINDFPAYGNLSGCTYKGKAACPLCGDNTLSNWLPFSRKTVYMNHRRFLPYKHPFRNKKECFNGEIERKKKPPIMTGAMAFERQSSIVNNFGKAKQNEEEKRKDKELKKKNKKKQQKKGQGSALTGANAASTSVTNAAANSKSVKRKRAVANAAGTSVTNAATSAAANSKSVKRKSAVAKDAGTSAAASSCAQDDDHPIFNKRSIFFDLPYWKELLLRHNIDVMHTEKNVCDSLISTILNIKNKTKDGLNSRKDLQSMGIREALHPQEVNGRTWLRSAPYNLSEKGRAIFYNRMRNLKVPYGYSSDLRRHFSKDGFLGVLKAHDYHVLMQQILPVALKGLLPDGPSTAIYRLCSYFNEICQRAVDLDRLVELEEEIAVTLCMLEMYFPPSFFDVMVHLTIHLAREVRLCGPVQYRWMYPFERHMKIFSAYVKNKAQPEACIAECYLGMECVRYSAVHCQKANEGEVNQIRDEDIQHDSTLTGRPLSKGVTVCIDSDMLKIAHRYVLFNTAVIDPYRKMHMDELRSFGTTSEDQLLSLHSNTFVDWIRQKVKMQIRQGISVSHTVEWLAYGPLENCVSYKGLQINGSRFITKDVKRVTQNSGVSIESKSLVEGRSQMSGFYGVLDQILVLDYNHMFQIPIFKCDWAHTHFGVKLEDGFTLVNLRQHKNQFQNDPFILASQARQIFYSRESDTSNWFVMLKPPPRGFHELEEYNEMEDTSCQPVEPSTLALQMDNLTESRC